MDRNIALHLGGAAAQPIGTPRPGPLDSLISAISTLLSPTSSAPASPSTPWSPPPQATPPTFAPQVVRATYPRPLDLMTKQQMGGPNVR